MPCFTIYCVGESIRQHNRGVRHAGGGHQGLARTDRRQTGLITPPMGMNVFVINSLARNVPTDVTFQGVFPFFLIMLARAAFPLLTAFLPAHLRIICLSLAVVATA